MTDPAAIAVPPVPLPPPPRQFRAGFGEVLLGIVFILGVSLITGLAWIIIESRNVVGGPGTVWGDAIEFLDQQAQSGLDLSPSWLVVFAAASAGSFAIWPWIVSRWRGTGSLRDDYGLRFTRTDLWWGLGGAALLIGFSVLLTEVIIPVFTDGDVGTNTEFLPITDLPWNLFLPFVMIAGPLTGVGEELMFRGLVLRVAAKRFAPIEAIGLQGLLFGAAHYGGAEGSALWATLTFTAVTGIGFGVIAHRTGRIAPCAAMHGANNTVALTLAWLGVQGV